MTPPADDQFEAMIATMPDPLPGAPKLQPCPFCGRGDLLDLLTRDGGADDEVRVVCAPCGATGPVGYRDEAIAGWNRAPRIHRLTVPTP